MTSTLARVDYDPMLDKSYADTRLGHHVVDWIAWLELGGYADRTWDQYERDLSRLCLMYPNLELEDVTDSELAHVLRTFPAPSRRVRKESFKSFFKWARLTRRVESNPMDFLPAVKRTQPQWIDVFTPAEQEALCGLPLLDGALMAVLLDAGLRKAEARSLRAAHCLLDRGRIVVFQGKGSKDRVVPLTPRLAGKLADLFTFEGVQDQDFLWYVRPAGHHVRRTKRVGEGSFARWWSRCLEDAGVRYRKPHTTRHTFATQWRSRGLDLDEIQMLLGHASIRTTSDLYVHTRIEDIAEHMLSISPDTW